MKIKTIKEPAPDVRKIVATYDYCDESGQLLFQTVRFEPKQFRQRRPNGQGGWIWNLNGVRLVLYKLGEIIKTPSKDWVFIVEGEKDAETLWSHGLAATTCPMGAGKWTDEYSTFLNDKENIAILPDNDEVGYKHATKIAESLLREAKACFGRVVHRVSSNCRDCQKRATSVIGSQKAERRINWLSMHGKHHYIFVKTYASTSCIIPPANHRQKGH